MLEKYENKISVEIKEELILLKPVLLFKEIIDIEFVNIFFNIEIVLRSFLTLLANVAEGKRSFTALKKKLSTIKNVSGNIKWTNSTQY